MSRSYPRTSNTVHTESWQTNLLISGSISAGLGILGLNFGIAGIIGGVSLGVVLSDYLFPSKAAAQTSADNVNSTQEESGASLQESDYTLPKSRISVSVKGRIYPGYSELDVGWGKSGVILHPDSLTMVVDSIEGSEIIQLEDISSQKLAATIESDDKEIVNDAMIWLMQVIDSAFQYELGPKDTRSFLRNDFREKFT